MFSCVGFGVAHVWACVLAQSRERWRCGVCHEKSARCGGAWAEISLVRCSASVNEGDEMRVIPAVGFVGPYSRVSFETSSAEEALACIGRVDRGALEAGLVDIRYRGSEGESLLPLLREREGVSVEE